VRSRGGEGGAWAVRDLIEAGLSEGADAATGYGISVARPVPGVWPGVMQCRHVGEDEAATPASSDLPLRFSSR